MADDAVIEILKGIQASIVALENKTQASIDALDRKVTRQHAMVTQDIRMIRTAVHDMGKTRVTEGEIIALHEDVNRMQHGLDVLTTRVELLEGHKQQGHKQQEQNVRWRTRQAIIHRSAAD
jgi:hypothetical protein